MARPTNPISGPADSILAQGADHVALCTTLSSLDISVPPRTSGRTTRHTEVWTVARLLATLSTTGRISYPITARHRDKPDIVLASGDIEIGIEITEATSTQYAAYCALAEREFPNTLLEPAHFGWNASQRTTVEMRAILSQQKLTSDGWAGNQPEQEWASFIRSAWETKLAKLQQPEFIKYARSWLAIYDNTPLVSIDLPMAVGIICQSVQEFWTRNPSFDAIFIERGQCIIVLTAASVDFLTLNDLWNHSQAG